MSVSATRSAKPTRARLRKHLRACLPHFHPTESDEVEELCTSESTIKVVDRSSEPVTSGRLDAPDTNLSWSDTEDMSPISVKPSSVFSVSKKGVTYGCDGSLVSCRFCEILQAGDEPLLYEDEDVVVFRPLAPVVVSHILVVPRRHIRNVNKLTAEDAALLRHMREVAAFVLRELPRPPVVLASSKAEKTHDDAEMSDEDDFKFAFHSPPFNSIDHVHMHAFRTRDGRFGCVGSIKYRTETWWCRSFDEVMARVGLRSRKQLKSDASAVESATKSKRHHASHPPCTSEVHSNNSMALTSVESLG
ncbi:hypothetical protein BBJ29_002045 [Phytophthora kernoviae]|uniref:HIT domain-containing protein n=1 Tax=Phytophthora kernoviae TaxID=325452 RepID=A0A3F2RSW1_9STRA|nr:hypothetical protein BBJ29_002045 [Phytophthora kernoviae]RLN63596.1 hypothetical protein BBP00_00004025 [Phytophthora kernoviae]